MPLVLERHAINLSICLVGLVWLARYSGKMYSRHLFSYGGLEFNWKYKPHFTVLVSSLEDEI